MPPLSSLGSATPTPAAPLELRHLNAGADGGAGAAARLEEIAGRTSGGALRREEERVAAILEQVRQQGERACLLDCASGFEQPCPCEVEWSVVSAVCVFMGIKGPWQSHACHGSRAQAGHLEGDMQQLVADLGAMQGLDGPHGRRVLSKVLQCTHNPPTKAAHVSQARTTM